MSDLGEIKWLAFVAKTNDYIPKGELLFFKPYFSEGGGGFGGIYQLEPHEALRYEVRAETAYEAIKKVKKLFHVQDTCEHRWEDGEWSNGECFQHCDKCGAYQ
jgi:hypothetical protein